jgi:ComF family protein
VALALPSGCLVCRETLHRPLFGPVCEKCWKGLPSLSPPFCPRCALPYAAEVAAGLCGPCRGKRRFRLARAAGPYEGALREVLHHFKYRGRFRLARALGRLAFERCLREGPLAGEALVPVPLHKRRRRERGYDQAQLLAEAIGAAAELPLARALVKVKDRPPQSTLGLAGRRRNAAGAYRAGKALVVGKRLILVDDVMTSGATAEACARALRRAGARSVDVLTVARVA